MGDIKYQTEQDDYSAPARLTFRGPPYGIVTDFIIARGMAKTRREAELRLVLITLLCLGIIAILIFWPDSSTTANIPLTPEEAAQLPNP